MRELALGFNELPIRHGLEARATGVSFFNFSFHMFITPKSGRHIAKAMLQLPTIPLVSINSLNLRAYSNLTSLTGGSISWGNSLKGKGCRLSFRVR